MGNMMAGVWQNKTAPDKQELRQEVKGGEGEADAQYERCLFIGPNSIFWGRKERVVSPRLTIRRFN